MSKARTSNSHPPSYVQPDDLSYALGLDDGRVWAGFTASTGRRFQNHYVLSWQFCEVPSRIEPATFRLYHCERLA